MQFVTCFGLCLYWSRWSIIKGCDLGFEVFPFVPSDGAKIILSNVEIDFSIFPIDGSITSCSPWQ